MDMCIYNNLYTEICLNQILYLNMCIPYIFEYIQICTMLLKTDVYCIFYLSVCVHTYVYIEHAVIIQKKKKEKKDFSLIH